jgi:transposase-like protein
MIFLLRCPKCKNNMKYNANSIYLADKRKRCVYCGKSFKVSENIIKKE